MYYYERAGNNAWALSFTIRPPGEEDILQFGFSIDVDRSYLIVGSLSQSVSIYERTGQATWDLVQTLISNGDNDHFGESVAIDFDTVTAAIGAPETSFPGAPRAGTVQVYQFDNETALWIRTQILLPNTMVIDGMFGEEIDLSGCPFKPS